MSWVSCVCIFVNEINKFLFKKTLYTQQSGNTSFCSTNDDVLTVRYEVSELIAKKLKPCGNGAWAKELLVKAAEKLGPKSVHLYQKLSLPKPTICERNWK